MSLFAIAGFVEPLLAGAGDPAPVYEEG